MYTYSLIIFRKTNNTLIISFEAFDEIEAKQIANNLTKNLEDFDYYSLSRRIYVKI